MTLPSGLTLHSMDARRSGRPRPPVLCVHGMFGGAWQFDGWLPLLADRCYEAHAVNLRGHHGSRTVVDHGKVTMRDFVEDALEVARVLGEPVVLGHSMGGLIVQKMAEAGAVRAAVLLCAAPPRGILATSPTLIGRQLKLLPAILCSRPMRANRSDADYLMFNRTLPAAADAIFARLVLESGTAGRDLTFGVVAVDESRVRLSLIHI